MKRFILLAVLLLAAGLAAQESPANETAPAQPAETAPAETPAETPAAEPSDDLSQPIQEMNLGLDPTRLQTFVGGSFSYQNRSNAMSTMTLRGDAMYRFSFLDDNRAWWGVNGGLPITKFNGGKWAESKTGIGDINVGIRRILPGSFRQVFYLDATWGITKNYGVSAGHPYPSTSEGTLNHGHNVLTPGWGFSTPLNDTMQLMGTVSYSMDISRVSWTNGQKISLLELKPMLLWAVSPDWIVRGDFTLGYSLASQVKAGYGLVPARDDKIRYMPAATVGHLMGEDKNLMLYGTLEFPLDAWSIGAKQQYSLKFGANYYLR